MKKLSAILLTLLIVGCGYNEDPFSITDFRGNTPKPPDDNNRPHAEDGSVFIDSDSDNYTFRENRTQSFQIKVRPVKLEFQKNIEVVIDNLGEFKGAQFDFSTGIFKWTPPEGTTFGTKPKELFLRIQAFARHDTDPKRFIEGHKSIPILVTNDPLSPIIQSFKVMGGNDLREGDSPRVEILVEDKEAGQLSTEWPRIFFDRIPAKGLGDDIIYVGDYMTLENVETDFSNHTFKFNYRLNLEDRELTSNYAMVGFKVFVHDFNVSKTSPEVEFSKKILNDLSEPETTWMDETIVHFDKENSISFDIEDKKKEGILSYKVKKGPPGSFVKCSPVESYKINCLFTWHPSGDPSLYPDTGSIEIDVVSKNHNPQDKLQVKKTFVNTYKMKFPGPSLRGVK